MGTGSVPVPESAVIGPDRRECEPTGEAPLSARSAPYGGIRASGQRTVCAPYKQEVPGSSPGPPTPSKPCYGLARARGRGDRGWRSCAGGRTPPMRKLHIAPVGDQRWLLTLDDDAEPPISEHGSRGEAETAARAYAETFGFPQIDVHGADGRVDVML